MKSARVIIAATMLFIALASAAIVESQSVAPAAEKHIPFKSPDESSAGALALRVTLGLVFVLLLGVGILLILRKYSVFTSAGKSSATRVIELVEVRRLTPKLTLFLVEADGARYLLAQSGDRVIQLAPALAQATQA